MIAVVDYRMGNLRSVEKGLERAGVPNVRVTDDPDAVGQAEAIVLPGVGAFGDAAANLKAGGMWDIVRERVADGTPFLGICLGMQLLVALGLENGEHAGLDVVGGTCERLPGGVKIPHMGWNTVEYTRDGRLFDGIPGGTAFYFVHSYRVVPADEACIIGTTEYGVRFASALERGRMFAVQFHPEKSSEDGIRLLANFWSTVRGG